MRYHAGDSTEAHVTIVLGAPAVSRWIEEATGWSIRKFVMTGRRYGTIQIQASDRVITATGPMPAALRRAIEAINGSR